MPGDPRQSRSGRASSRPAPGRPRGVAAAPRPAAPRWRWPPGSQRSEGAPRSPVSPGPSIFRRGNVLFPQLAFRREHPLVGDFDLFGHLAHSFPRPACGFCKIVARPIHRGQAKSSPSRAFMAERRRPPDARRPRRPPARPRRLPLGPRAEPPRRPRLLCSRRRTSWPPRSTAATARSSPRSSATCSSRSPSSPGSPRRPTPSAAHRSIDGVHRKMVERHPHVFGDESLADAEAVRQAWERRKLQQEPRRESLLAGVPASLPALLAAYRLTQKAAGVGFDWPDAGAVFAKARRGDRRAQRGARRRRPRGGARGGRATSSSPSPTSPASSTSTPRPPWRAPTASSASASPRVEEGLAERGEDAAEATLDEMDALWEAAKRER